MNDVLYITIDTEFNKLVEFWTTRGHDIITARSFATLQLLEMYS